MDEYFDSDDAIENYKKTNKDVLDVEEVSDDELNKELEGIEHKMIALLLEKKELKQLKQKQKSKNKNKMRKSKLKGPQQLREVEFFGNQSEMKMSPNFKMKRSYNSQSRMEAPKSEMNDYYNSNFEQHASFELKEKPVHMESSKWQKLYKKIKKNLAELKLSQDMLIKQTNQAYTEKYGNKNKYRDMKRSKNKMQLSEQDTISDMTIKERKEVEADIEPSILKQVEKAQMMKDNKDKFMTGMFAKQADKISKRSFNKLHKGTMYEGSDSSDSEEQDTKERIAQLRSNAEKHALQELEEIEKRKNNQESRMYKGFDFSDPEEQDIDLQSIKGSRNQGLYSYREDYHRYSGNHISEIADSSSNEDTNFYVNKYMKRIDDFINHPDNYIHKNIEYTKAQELLQYTIELGLMKDDKIEGSQKETILQILRKRIKNKYNR
ncbi:MAG: hypothetical protein AAFO15_00050 [Pseudomonadota bacterium]